MTNAGFVEPLRYAIRALRREILEFRLDYPLEIVPEAGPKESLHYYLYSEKLSWSVMSMDSAGIPRARGRLTGEVYKPAYIAWWGLVNLGHFLRHRNKSSRDVFLNQVNWLESNAVMGADGAVVWPNRFDCIQGTTFLKAPWVSAYDQGLAISALVRGYRLTQNPHLLELLKHASRVFESPKVVYEFLLGRSVYSWSCPELLSRAYSTASSRRFWAYTICW